MRTTTRHHLKALACTATVLATVSIIGFVAASALADDITPPVTVPTNTVGPVPAPDPPPVPPPAPAPAPDRVQQPVQSAPPDPAVSHPTAPATPPSSVGHASRATHRPAAHRKNRKRVSKPRHQAQRVDKTTPVFPSGRNAESPTAGRSRGIWSPFFLLALAAAVLTVVAVKVIRPEGRNRWSPAAIRRRRRSRKVLLPWEDPTANAGSTLIETPVEPEVQPMPEPVPNAPLVAGAAMATRGAPTVAEQHPPNLPEEPQPDEPLDELCQIAVWRGYAKSCFYARLQQPEADEEFAVAESPRFRLRGNGAPERTEATEAAHLALLQALLADGWKLDGAADPWYASRLRRELSTDR